MPDEKAGKDQCDHDGDCLHLQVVPVERVQALISQPWQLLERDDDPFCGIIAEMEEGIVLVAMSPSKLAGEYIVAAHNGSLARRGTEHDTGAYL